MQPYDVTQLPNGLRLVTVALPQLHSVTACLAVGCGSRHESLGQWGLSHLLEHMLFRGSRRHPDIRSLAHAFEVVGGQLEAATWRDHTALWCSVHPSGLAPVLAALADLVAGPSLTDLPLERRIVEAELQAELDADGADHDLGNLSRAQIWRQHPMGRRLLGSQASLRRQRLAHLRRHHAAHYRAGNMVLCVAGPIDVAQVRAQVARHWGQVPAGPSLAQPPALPPRFAPAEPLLWQPGPGPQTALQLTFPALPDAHSDFVAQELLSCVLDDGMTSRLPRAVFEARGLAYELNSGLDCYADAGLYDIELWVQPRRLMEAVRCVLGALAQFLDEGVQPAELNLARQRQLQALEFALDEPADLAHDYACNALFGRPRQLHQLAQQLQAVQRRDLMRVAQRLFASGQLHLTVQGPAAPSTLARLRRLLRAFAARGARPPSSTRLAG